MTTSERKPPKGRSRAASDDVPDRRNDPGPFPTRFMLPTLRDATTLSRSEADVVVPSVDDLDARFERQRLLGKGGVGEVWLAVDRQTQARVALKVLHRLVHGATSVLLAEADATSRVRHPSVVSVLEAGLAGHTAFVAFEYVDGRSLRARMCEPIDRATTFRWLHEIASGLAAAHAADVLHLDIKPENILIGSDGRARLIDFGLARTRVGEACIATTGETSGTPAYMAPELWANEAVCDGTDVWSFVVLAYELLNGQRPCKGATATDLMLEVLCINGVSPPPLPDDVHPELVALLARGLDRWRGHRPYMHEIEKALARHAR